MNEKVCSWMESNGFDEQLATPTNQFNINSFGFENMDNINFENIKVFHQGRKVN